MWSPSLECMGTGSAWQTRFDKITEDVESYVDMIAERAVQLGGIAEGHRSCSRRARSLLEEYPPVIAAGSAHVEAVARALCTFGREARMSIDETNALGGCRGRFRKKSRLYRRQVDLVCRSPHPGRQVI